MLLQAESLRYVTEPITHTVIVDNDPDIKSWYSMLEPYYTVHTLNLISGPKLNSTVWWNDGWRRQQVYKLLAYKYIKDSYLILDSQNFFIRPCTISLWNNICGTGIFWPDAVNNLNEIEKITLNTLVTYSNYLDIPICYRIRTDGVPFVINYEVMKHYDIDLLVNDFMQQLCVPIEFVFYNLLAQKVNYLGKSIRTVMHDLVRLSNSAFPSTIWSKDTCYLAGIHRRFLVRHNNRKRVNLWLCQQGFVNCL